MMDEERDLEGANVTPNVDDDIGDPLSEIEDSPSTQAEDSEEDEVASVETAAPSRSSGRRRFANYIPMIYVDKESPYTRRVAIINREDNSITFVMTEANGKERRYNAAFEDIEVN